SGGEKRRLEIARCLVCDPLLILLDEPFTGIDPMTIADIKGIIRNLREQGIGILITDHQVREGLTITDRSYLIKDGKVRTDGTPQQIVRDPIAIADYLGSGFSDERLSAPPAPTPIAERPTGETVSFIVEQERVRRLVDRLRTNDFEQSARELGQPGPSGLPALLGGVGRRRLEEPPPALHAPKLPPRPP